MFRPMLRVEIVGVVISSSVSMLASWPYTRSPPTRGHVNGFASAAVMRLAMRIDDNNRCFMREDFRHTTRIFCSGSSGRGRESLNVIIQEVKTVDSEEIRSTAFAHVKS